MESNMKGFFSQKSKMKVILKQNVNLYLWILLRWRIQQQWHRQKPQLIPSNNHHHLPSSHRLKNEHFASNLFFLRTLRFLIKYQIKTGNTHCGPLRAARDDSDWNHLPRVVTNAHYRRDRIPNFELIIKKSKLKIFARVWKFFFNVSLKCPFPSSWISD